MLYNGKIATADPMLWSNLFIDLMDIHINTH